MSGQPKNRARPKQADSYDREVYQGMGVKTIWIEDWSDLPKVIRAVQPAAKKAPR